MKRVNVLFVLALMSLAGLAMVAIADDATTQPAPTPTRRARMVAPFNLLTDLTDDQKSKIADIHKTELAAEKDLKAKEHDDILALLTDDQKKELDDALAKETDEKKATEEEDRAKAEQQKADTLMKDAGAATQP
jgi:Spy/CpxP family protein refolding chaperone